MVRNCLEKSGLHQHGGGERTSEVTLSQSSGRKTVQLKEVQEGMLTVDDDCRKRDLQQSHFKMT